jgi:hypothetical protein
MEVGYGKVATWLTGKTETSELLIMGRHGIVSFKVVRSGNGKKVQVFSGFDVRTWTWGTGPTGEGTMDLALWEHKYIEAQEKAAKKWGSKVHDIPYGDISSMLTGLDADIGEAIRDAIRSDEKVSSHWSMINGLIPPVASGKSKGDHPATPPETPKRSAEQAFRERAAADEEWGMF